MKSSRPKFSQERYDKYDAAAKAAALDYLGRTYDHRDIIAVKENFKDDLILLTEQGHIKVQVEIRATWKPKIFPYSNLHLPKSKVDNALKNNSCVWFLIFNESCTAVAKIVLEEGKMYKLIGKVNKYSPVIPEMFYEFSLEDMEFAYD